MLDHERQRAFDKRCSQYRHGNGRGMRIAMSKLRDGLRPPKPKCAVAQFMKFFCESIERFDMFRSTIHTALDDILDDRIGTCTHLVASGFATTHRLQFFARSAAREHHSY